MEFLTMDEIATVLRYLQLYSHQAHNLTKGLTFFQDHGFFGDLYPAYESAYDDVVERSIGLGNPIDISIANKQAAERLPEDNETEVEACLKHILSAEIHLCQEIEKVCDSCSIGTEQMLGNIADLSEVRQYKIKQRLA
jgi:DNA-binding ferritin-like protein